MHRLKNLAFIFCIAAIPAIEARAVTVSLQAGAGGQSASIIEDAMLVQESLNDNFGGRADLEIGVPGNGQVRTSVMRFDVTDPSLGLYAGGSPLFYSVESVTLTLTTTGVSSNSTNMGLRIAAGQNAQGDWVEGTGTAAVSGGDAGMVTYSERREGAATGWLPDTNYTRGTGDGALGSLALYPGINTSFSISLSPLPGENLGDLLNRWAFGNNEGILLNDINRVGFARWFVHSSESATVSARPMLTIQFTVIPEPASAMLGLLALAALGCRRHRSLRVRP